MTNRPEVQPVIPGLEQATPSAGSLEQATTKQIDRLRELGYLEDHHAGLAELARVAARDIDLSFGRGAPSGRANLLRVMNEIFESLPQPEQASKDALSEVVAALERDLEEHDARAGS